MARTVIKENPSACAALLLLQWHELNWPLPHLIMPTPGDWFSEDPFPCRKAMAKELATTLGTTYFSGLRLCRSSFQSPQKPLEDQMALMDTQPPRAKMVAVRAGTRVVNKRILLIHDLCSTGGSLEASALALLEHGALEVLGMSFADIRH